MGTQTVLKFAEGVKMFRMIHGIGGNDSEDKEIARKFVEECRRVPGLGFNRFIRDYYDTEGFALLRG